MKLVSLLSLRSKIILVAMVSCLIAVILSGSALQVMLWQSEKRQMHEDLRIMAKVVAQRSAAALEFDDEALARENLQALAEYPGIRGACLHDASGRLLAGESFGHAIDECSREEARDTRFSWVSDMTVVVPVNANQSTLGFLKIMSDYADLQHRALRNTSAVVVSMLFALLVTWMLARRLQVLVTRPLQALSDTAIRVTNSNDYSVRAPMLEGGREISHLTRAFNEMLRRIDVERSALTESERRYRTLTDNSPVGIFETTANGEFRYVNEKFMAITALRSQEISLAEADLLILFDDGEPFSAKWCQALTSGQDFALDFRRERDKQHRITGVGRAMPLHDDAGVLTGYLGSLTDITELKRTKDKLEQLAFFDPLTNLANRRMIMDSIAHDLSLSERGEYRFALLMLDLDQFKRVNDTFGHDAGDLLLKICAERLGACVRPSDIVARMGGDEFLVLLRNIRHGDEASTVASRILASFRHPVGIGSHRVIVTSSIGIVYGPQDGRDPATLLKNADLAMYNAKGAGRNACRAFDDAMGRAIREELDIENELRIAIAEEQFTLYFQPQITLDGSYHLVGAEALVRWVHPVRGMVQPSAFIPVAESTGMIVQLGRWVIRESCRTVNVLRESGVFPELQRISINLSPRQLHDPHLLETIRDALDEFDVQPSWLEFEITESMLMDDVERSIDILDALRATGVELAIDDFGTGYSSLSYLKRFPIHTLKIDRSFVMDIPDDRSDMEISAAVIAMAHKLDLKVVAEGVETEAQLRFLEDNRCDLCQGYLFARPMPLDTLLASRRSGH